MNPWVQIVLVLCAVALTGALVPAILSLKRAGDRAERILSIVEQDLGPLLAEVKGLSQEAHGLTKQARDELARIGAMVDRAREVSEKAGQVVWAVASLTRTGQLLGIMAGLRAGARVFLGRLRRS